MPDKDDASSLLAWGKNSDESVSENPWPSPWLQTAHTAFRGLVPCSGGSLLTQSSVPHMSMCCSKEIGVNTSSANRITATDQCPFLFQVFAFLGETLVAMNWAVMADILLVSSPPKPPHEALLRDIVVRRFHLCPQYIVIPNRRSTAEALQVMFIHLLGDCGSPYIVGAVSCSWCCVLWARPLCVPGSINAVLTPASADL